MNCEGPGEEISGALDACVFQLDRVLVREIIRLSVSDQKEGVWRSSRVLDREASALVVVDVQDRLLAKINTRRRVVWNSSRLLRGAGLLKVRVVASEQYAEKLGPTVAELAEFLPTRHDKREFSFAALSPVVEELAAAGCSQLVLCGIETHVCIMQSALDLLAAGFDVYVVADAVGARESEDHVLALERMRGEGVSLVTTESVLFEWCRTSLDPQFKGISRIVQETPSESGAGIGFVVRS